VDGDGFALIIDRDDVGFTARLYRLLEAFVWEEHGTRSAFSGLLKAHRGTLLQVGGGHDNPAIFGPLHLDVVENGQAGFTDDLAEAKGGGFQFCDWELNFAHVGFLSLLWVGVKWEQIPDIWLADDSPPFTYVADEILFVLPKDNRWQHARAQF
jgi:hypothetical protein